MMQGMEDSGFDTSFGSSGSESSPGSSVDDWRSTGSGEEEDIIHIKDNIHGQIEVPLLCRAIIDTPQFDRLRGLKQLGNTHYVYPAAKHTRWEHSLGVMHLAGEMMDHLMKRRPGCADETDKICVMMAGLCHDLGHGPFSHLWESFVREASPGTNWCHEETSIAMLDFIIKENNLMPKFQRHGLTERDILFVKPGTDQLGRGKDKLFLYEIVANKRDSVDVDKFDYFLRDNAALGLGLTFDYRRFIRNTAILCYEGENRLCYRDKELNSIKEMFIQRARLHRDAYQHNTVKIIDRMVLDALLEADRHHLSLPGPDGESFTLIQACESMERFCQLTDEYLLRSLQYSSAPELGNARNIINRIIKRDLYKLVEVVDGPLEKIQTSIEFPLVVIKKSITMCMGDSNPVEKVLFINKSGQIEKFTMEQLRKDFSYKFSREQFLIVSRE